jgi:hypothetical protein
VRREGVNSAKNATLSKSKFAALVDVSRGRISQMVAEGLPVDKRGQIRVDAGRAWIDANIKPSRRRIRRSDGDAAQSLKIKREKAEAEIAFLKAECMAENLIDRVTTLQTIEGRARFERDAWIGWVNRVAPDVAAAGGDLSAVVAVLDRHVREQLMQLAETPLEGIDER